MNENSPTGYISTNTIMFAQNVIQSLEDMLGKSFQLNKSSFRETPFPPQFNMIAYIHFSGKIQGYYILCLDEIVAARLADIGEKEIPAEDIRELREEFGGFVKELLNLAVGQSISDIEQSFGELTYSPAIIVYGEIMFPDILSGNVRLEGEEGSIQCGFTLDLAELKIGRKLESALGELEKKTLEACHRGKEVESILQLIPCVLVAVSPEGRVIPGYSPKTASLIGYEPGKDIVGSDLHALLNLDTSGSQVMQDFFTMLRKGWHFSFESLLQMCEGKFLSQHGKRYKLDWLPVVNDQTKILEKLLVIIRDTTAIHSSEMTRTQRRP